MKYNKTLVKISCSILLIYVVMITSFYFVSGKQLSFRDSKKNIVVDAATEVTPELVEGVVAEQIFTNRVEMLKSVNVRIATYKRQNHGSLILELYEIGNNTLITSNKNNIASMRDWDFVEISIPDSYQNVLYEKKLKLRAYTDKAYAGTSVSLYTTTNNKVTGVQLFVNGKESVSNLCFNTQGIDRIWIGLNYWKITITIFILLLIYLVFCNYKASKGKGSILLNTLVALNKYSFLISQLVSRDFRTKYKRSVLGVLWSFVNPLLTMAVQYFVFSNIFKFEIENFPVYLLIGVLIFNFFNEAVSLTLLSVVGNAGLITKVYVPKYIYPVSRILSSTINFVIALIPLFMVIVFTGTKFAISYTLIIYPIAFMFIFSLGLGMLLASLMVFFRDIQFIWGVVSVMWMYATPIFYPISIIPEKYKFIVELNPIYYFTQIMRTCIIQGVSPEPLLYIKAFVSALVMFLVGALFFKKTQDKFVLHM